MEGKVRKGDPTIEFDEEFESQHIDDIPADDDINVDYLDETEELD